MEKRKIVRIVKIIASLSCFILCIYILNNVLYEKKDILHGHEMGESFDVTEKKGDLDNQKILGHETVSTEYLHDGKGLYFISYTFKPEEKGLLKQLTGLFGKPLRRNGYYYFYAFDEVDVFFFPDVMSVQMVFVTNRDMMHQMDFVNNFLNLFTE